MKLNYWFKAFRLRTLPLSISCILMAFGLARINFKVDLIVLFLCLTTTILLQILSNLANDYGDGVRNTDQNRTGEQRMVQSALISKQEMLSAVVVFSFLSFISGVILLYFSIGFQHILKLIFFLVLGVFSIWGAIKYTMGKSPYGYHGFGDVFVFIFFGLIGICGSYFLFTNDLSSIVFPGILVCGCLSVAVLNMNNMRDFESDKAAGKLTVVVRRGIKWAKFYHIFLISTAILAFASLFIINFKPMLLFGLFPVLILFINGRKVLRTANCNELDSELKKIALSAFISSLIVAVAFI